MIENTKDPTFNVREAIAESSERLDDLRKSEIKRIDEKIALIDSKTQTQFNSAKEAVGIASVAQEKAMAAALEGTKDAINKADVNTDKRFGSLSEKIDAVIETINKNSGAQGIYVTHVDLSNEMSKLRSDFETMLRPVVTFMNNNQGKSQGISSSWVILLGATGFISTIVGIFMMLRNLP